jgi:hypothetical protein
VSRHEPEPPIDPPTGTFVIADCGDEVYEGENIYEWNGKTLCPDCFKSAINELSAEELAVRLKCNFATIGGAEFHSC